MAAKNEVQTSIFYNVKNGKFQRLADENEADAIKVEKSDKSGHYFIKNFNKIFSHVKGISITEKEYQGNKYEVIYLKLHDGQNSEQIEANIEYNVAVTFISCLSAMCDNGDILNEIEFGVGLDKDEREFGFVKVNGVNAPRIFNKENPLPKWNEIKVPNKKSLWDRSEQTKVLKEHIEKINKHLGYSKTVETTNPLTGVDDMQGLKEVIYYTKKGVPLTKEEAKHAAEKGELLYDSSKNVIAFDDLPF